MDARLSSIEGFHPIATIVGAAPANGNQKIQTVVRKLKPIQDLAVMNRPAGNFPTFMAQPLHDREKIQSRLIDALTTLMQEKWLPHGLRSLLVEELLIIKDELLATDHPDYRNIACHIHSIALTTFAYPELILKSKTVASIRILDLEMTPFSTLKQENHLSETNQKRVS